MKKIKTKQIYFNSFDYLRVFFAFAIVAWHTKALGNTSLLNENFSFNLRDFTYANVFLLAVPLFVQVSLFLYLFNRNNKQHYFVKRFSQVAFLYFFWMALLILIFYKEAGLGIFKNPVFWLSGGATPLYFLAVLMVLTIFLEIYSRLSNIIKNKAYVILTMFLLIVSVGSIVGKHYSFGGLNPNISTYMFAHWSPINFLPFVFSSAIFYFAYEKKLLEKINFKFAGALLALGLLSIFVEYLYFQGSSYLYEGMVIPSYSRISLIVSAFLVFYIAITSKIQPSKTVQKIAGLTLGIYIMHVFIMNILAGLFPSSFEVYKNSVVYFGVVLILSLFASSLLKEKRIV